MLERTLVFVDTSYLLASFYNSWETGARSQLEIDLPEVVRVIQRMAVNQLDQPVHRQNWYDGIPDSGPHRYQRALRSEPGVQLRAGQLIEWGERRTQKAVDTRLVADMVKAALTGTCSDIILVSGDADMIPGVEEAVDAGVRVHLYGFGWDSMSANLRFACDSTTILDPREDFRDCMRLQILEGPLPTAVHCTDGHPGEDTACGDAVTGTVTDVSVTETTMTVDGGADAATVAPETAADHPTEAPGPAETAGPTAPTAPAAPTEETSAPTAPESKARYKPLGDAEPVEDLSGTSVVPDLRPRSKRRRQHPAAPAAPAAPASPGTPAGTPAAPGGPAGPTSPAGSAAGHVGHTPSPADLAAGHLSTAHPDTPVPVHPPRTPEPTGPAPAGNTAPDTEPDAPAPTTPGAAPESADDEPARPSPSMMAPRRRLRSRYVPLPTEIWQSSGEQSPFDVGQQYAVWWYEHAATVDQRDAAHTLSGGGLPPAVDRPLVQFACETLHEFTLTETQRVKLRDGFHSGIRGILLNPRKR